MATGDAPPPEYGGSELPSIAATFLIKFDLKVGYTIAWKRTASGVDIEGIVEYKCLPSGLHNMKEDLVYFLHDDKYAGLGAFIHGTADASERSARLLAVGVLVPLSYGRLGRSWLHAEPLRQMARNLVNDIKQIEPLEKYWETYRLDFKDAAAGASTPSPLATSRPSVSQLGHSRNRALSNATVALPAEQSLAPFHPALSILDFLDSFGPLIFPLHRAALLRKRILIVSAPPVRTLCEYVYDTSILSSLPSSLESLLPSTSDAAHRLRPLFSVGIHDIPYLNDLSKAHNQPSGEDEYPSLPPPGFIACTTDEVLSTKPQLYDVLVELPHKQLHAAKQKQWPTLKTSDKQPILATQRDLRRYKSLIQELRRLSKGTPTAPPEAEDDAANDSEDEDEGARLLRPDSVHRRDSSSTPADDDEDDEEFENLPLEPVKWSAVAYSSFMWWASAGEKDAALADEDDQNRTLLTDLVGRRGPGSDVQASWSSIAGKGASVQTAIVAYFHRLTGLMLGTLAEMCEGEGEGEDGESDSGSDTIGDGEVKIRSEDVARMGLDAWSEVDKRVAGELLELYFGRRAVVKGAIVEWCGMRIC